MCIDSADDLVRIVAGDSAVVKRDEELEVVTILLCGIVCIAELGIGEWVVANVQGKAIDESRCCRFNIVVPIHRGVGSIVTDDDVGEDSFAMSLGYCSQQAK